MCLKTTAEEAVARDAAHEFVAFVIRAEAETGAGVELMKEFIDDHRGDTEIKPLKTLEFVQRFVEYEAKVHTGAIIA